MNEKTSILNKIIAWFEKLSTLTKAIISIGTVVTVFSGYMAVHDKKVINRYEEIVEQESVKNQLKEVEEQLGYVIRFQIRDSIRTRRDNEKYNQKIDSLTRITGTLINVNSNLKEYMIETVPTKQEVLRIVKIFENKKINWYDTLDTKILIRKK